jgi:hypothetical protein
MLKLKYNPAVAGAPNQYGTLVDRLEAGDDSLLQEFPKAQAGFIPPEAALSNAISTWLARRGARPEPVIVMVHGYLFNPNDSLDTDQNSPFSSVYGVPPATNYHLSWLPLVGECDQMGGDKAENAIAFAYKSVAGFAEFAGAGWNFSYQHAVFDLAPLAARALAAILAALAAQTPLVRILAHSLGTRTVGQAIRLLRARMPANLERLVLLDGAEFCVDAAANFAGCAFDVFNIVNRTDTVLRLGGDELCAPIRPNNSLSARVIGFDGLGNNARWLDLQLDNPALVRWFAQGNAPDGKPYAIDALAREESHPFAGLDHWSCYTNDGNRALVRDLLFSDVMTVAQMQAHRVPDGTDAPARGHFNDQPIPPTPQSRMERQRQLAQVTTAGGEG